MWVATRNRKQIINKDSAGSGPKRYEGKKPYPGPPPGYPWGPEGHQTASGLELPAAS